MMMCPRSAWSIKLMVLSIKLAYCTALTTAIENNLQTQSPDYHEMNTVNSVMKSHCDKILLVC